MERRKHDDEKIERHIWRIIALILFWGSIIMAIFVLRI